MKRLLILACALALVFSLGVSSALAVGYQQAAGARAASGVQRRFKPAVMTGLTNFARAGSRSLANAGGMRLTFGGGTTSDNAVLLPYPSELPSGSVSSVGKTDDVYWFYMDAGGQMDFHLDPENHGAQIALKVFEDGSDLSEAQVLLSDTEYGNYPHTTSFVAPWDGYYLLDVRAVNGTTNYEMPYDWWYGPNDNIYPWEDGICPVIPASPVSQWLSGTWDVDDVYRAPLRAGDALALNLGALYDYGSDDLDLDLFLLGPSAVDVWPHTIAENPTTLRESRATAPAADVITYKATVTGNYFVDIAAYSGDGPSYLQWTVNPVRPSISRSPSSSRPTYRRKSGVAKYKLSARFTNGMGLQVARHRVYLQTSSNRRTWKSSYAFTTTANGSATKSFASRKKSVKYYRWAIKTVTGKYSYSASQKVTVR